MAGSCRGGKGEGMGILYSCAAKDCGYLFASSQWVQGGLSGGGDPGHALAWVLAGVAQ